MKVLVTEMPLSEYECPFSEEYTTRVMDNNMRWKVERICYECSVTKEDCDLNCGKCSGLKVLEKE